MLVHDPTVYAIHFVAVPSFREGKKREAVRDFLNAAATEFARAVKQEPPKPILQLEDYPEEYIDLLTSVDPTAVASGATMNLDVRTLHDTVLLRTTTLHTGAFDLEKVKTLDFNAPLPQPCGDVPYLGAFRVLYVETENQRAKRAEVGKALATTLNRTWLAKAEPIVTPLGTMLFGVEPRQPHQKAEAPALDLLFVGGRISAEMVENDQSYPFLFVLPQLALCHLKVRNSAGNIRKTWLPKLSERESALRDLLPKPGDPKQTHLQMLEQNDNIMFRQAELVEAVERVRAELRTMRINRDNFTTAAAQSFKRAADKLKHQLIDPWMLPTELQAENDIGYVEGTLQLAETHFKSIEAGAAADQARELKWINWSVIILGGLSLLTGLLSVYLAWRALPTPAVSTPASAVSAQPRSTATP